VAGKPDIRERHRVIAPRSVPPRRHHLPEDPPGAVFKAMAGVHEIKSAGLFLIGSSRADGYTLIRKANELAPSALVQAETSWQTQQVAGVRTATRG
jgi:hypothetical protein